MIKQLAYRFRLEPADEQAALMRQFAGCRRFIYNKGLALQKERFEKGEKLLSYAALTKVLKAEWKRDFPFLYDCHSQPLQQSLKDLSEAFSRFFDKSLDAGFPQFKKKFRSRESFRYPQGFKVDNRRIFLPKLGWMRFRKSREIVGEMNSVTVSFYAGHWYASIQCTQIMDDPKPTATSIVGADAGVVRLYTLSDGTIFFPITETQKWERKICSLQRKLARKTKNSNGWKAMKARIGKVHAKIAAIREDVLHKVSTAISKNHAVVVLEDLKVKNMTASAKGTVEAPGRNVAQKAGLNRAILNHGWGKFSWFMDYKMVWTGGECLLVPPQYTSQKCSCCKYVHADNRVSQGLFHCQSCGYTANADENAATNIEEAGHALIACRARDEAVSPATGTPAAALAA